MNKGRKTLQTITDSNLEPFFITVDDYCYTVKERVSSDITHFKSNGKARSYEKSLSYHPTLSRAIEQIAELKSGVGNFHNLDDFLQKYNQIKNQIKEYANKITSSI
jgi:hypothetical protein